MECIGVGAGLGEVDGPVVGVELKDSEVGHGLGTCDGKNVGMASSLQTTSQVTLMRVCSEREGSKEIGGYTCKIALLR